MGEKRLVTPLPASRQRTSVYVTSSGDAYKDPPGVSTVSSLEYDERNNPGLTSNSEFFF